MLLDQYADTLINILSTIRDTQRQQILAAAQLAADTLCKDGLIYLFGSGHSHLLAEEGFYRAGGLACVYPILKEPLMLHHSATESSVLEKVTGQAAAVLEGYDFSEKDLLIVISTSGVNSVPVEVAVEAKRRGVKVIGISSGAYGDVAPRNCHNLRLSETVDISIDNLAPRGDACLQPEGLDQKMTPVSTVSGTYILHSILTEAVQLSLNRGINVPIYRSANIPENAEHNRKLFETYKPRIHCL